MSSCALLRAWEGSERRLFEVAKEYQRARRDTQRETESIREIGHMKTEVTPCMGGFTWTQLATIIMPFLC
jgi:hypothetical protein